MQGRRPVSDLTARPARDRATRTRLFPTQAQLGDISKDVVTHGKRPIFDPLDQIVEGWLAFCIDEPAMAGLSHGTLDQKMRGASGLGSSPVILFKPERRAEIPCLPAAKDL